MPLLLTKMLKITQLTMLMDNGNYEINPLIRSEWRRYIRGKEAFRVQITFLGVMAVMTLFFLGIESLNSINSGNINLSIAARKFFQSLSILLLIFLSLASIGSNLAAISSEIEKKRMDLLLLTYIEPHELLFGKLYGSTCGLSILAILSLPFFSIVFFVGGISIVEVLLWSFAIILIPIFFGLIGISLSAIARTKRKARFFLGIFFMALLITFGIHIQQWVIAVLILILSTIAIVFNALQKIRKMQELIL